MGTDSQRVAKLPDEILEAQKFRSDLLKWKLVLVATLGAAGFGLMEKVAPAPLLLALVPFVCLYVDLLCTHLNLRQLVIGTYFRTVQRDPYETFVQVNRHAFDLEDWALYWSTMAACALVALTGAYFLLLTSPTGPRRIPMGWVLFLAGGLGFLMSYLTFRRSRSRGRLHRSTDERFATLAVENKALYAFLRPRYSGEGLAALGQFLTQKGVFRFRALPNGLFPAAAGAHAGDASGYQHIWVRDNVHIAHAHFLWGDVRTAAHTATTLLAYFRAHAHRFLDIIEGRVDAADPMNRPHIRFHGETLGELSQTWPHAQNDALGAFLWFYCRLARAGQVPCGLEALECLGLFPAYFRAIAYWQDADSGHWEEDRKVSASSIGAVLAGLRELQRLLDKPELKADPIHSRLGLDPDLLQELRTLGERSLDEILPCEALEPASSYRRYDSALLFLLYPLDILDQEAWTDPILSDIATHLQGEHGIRRYLGDSYWFPDYREALAPESRSGDFSGNLRARNALARGGEEAQWCLFDPILSIIHGRRYLALAEGKAWARAEEALALQTHHFNRALGQLTGKVAPFPECSLPEAYYLKKGHFVPNDHTPLLWAQANLWSALHAMHRSTEVAEGKMGA